MLRSAVLVFVLYVVHAVAASAADDGDFLAAKSAFERGDRERVEQLAPKLAGHVLARYVDYWRLKLALDGAPDEDVRGFLTRNAGSALADRLRAEWLKALGMRGRWSVFGAEYAPSDSDDAELKCYALQYRQQTDPQGALAAAKPLWFTGAFSPPSCLPLFDALIGRNDITVADRRARFRLATEAGNLKLAEQIGSELPARNHIGTRELMRIDRDPARALARGEFPWKDAAGQELALFALERAARTDAVGIRAAWERQRGRLPAAERAYGNARLAYHAARQLVPQANEWFREARDASLTPAQQAWRVRAALRVLAWTDVIAAIEAMPATAAEDPAWRYWKARALLAVGREAEAKPIFQGLATDQHYYALLAAEALGRGDEKMRAPAIAPAESVTPSALAVFGARSDVRRAVKLAELEMRAESQREWYYAVRHLDDDALLVAAEYARQHDLYDRAINTAERTSVRHDFRLRYLMPYRDQFASAARDQDVDPALLFGLARQESRFNAGIVSSAGAMGLMQLMPATARWVAKQLGRSDYSPREITDVGINTQFGAFYFRHWFERLERLPALAAAAYNAGPGRAQAWRGATPLEGAIWVETIPFNETRDYVKKVLANAMFYARMLEQPYVPLTSRLGVIPPRGTSNASTLAAVSR